MRRPAKGGTTHPPVTRPGMGYGRPLRARPVPARRVDFVAEFAALLRGEIIGFGAERVDERSSVAGSDRSG